MSECDNNHPIDLSRRSDSVETRKTPSPYNSSSFTETSPSLENDSPTTSQSRKKVLAHKRSNTPTNRYQSNSYIGHGFPSANYSKHERITPSPPEDIQMHHHFMRESVNSAIPHSNAAEMNPYYLNALSTQRTFLNGTSDSSSPEAEATVAQHSIDSNHDRKSSRPFKLYTKDPMSLTASIPLSTDQYGLFRQQVLNQLYPGGEPTVSNPKMRRVARKSYDGSEHSEIDYNHHEHSEQMADHKQNDAKNQSDSSSSGASNSKGLVKDTAYYERRRKNNAAAKKSRDRRRQKEDDLAIRAAFLQRENLELKYELAALKRQLAQHAVS